ncbi:response regulator transcription factor [Cellulomonas soli]|uniref:helix-turn-helix transcriptional regulator n=1 Tax=Cellulomonas soli TaxID=931535 RepID=UPI003F87EDA8
MSIEPLRREVSTAARPAARSVPQPSTPRGASAVPQMCLVVPEVADGEGEALVRNLRRRGAHRVVVLTRRAGRDELNAMLAGGLRGAVAGAVEQAVSRPAVVVPVPRRSLPELTAREIGVLELVAAGRSNRLVGEALGLSALTVKSHLARISRKLGTGDRAELVAIAFRAGLLD